MRENQLHSFEAGLQSHLPFGQRDAIKRRAGTCAACSSCLEIDRLNTRCRAIGGKHVPLVLGSCKLRKWPEDTPNDAIASPVVNRDGDSHSQIISRESLYSEQWRSAEETTKDSGVLGLKRKTYSPGVTLITPTGDRPEAFRLCVRWMDHQQVEGNGPIQWIIVDDGRIPVDSSCYAHLIDKGWTVDHLRREPQDGDPLHTLCVNMLVAIHEIKHDKILIIEDDDYYARDYILTVSDWLEHADLVGDTSARLYFLQTRSCQFFHNVCLAGWCKTGFRPAVIPTVWHAAASSSHHALDLRVWRGWRGTKYLRQDSAAQEGLCIGIKGVPGRQGHTWQAGCNTAEDSSLVKLRHWIGQDTEHYIDLLGDEKTQAQNGIYGHRLVEHQKAQPRKEAVFDASDLQPGDRNYKAYVGPPAQYDLMGATQFRLLCTLGLRANHSLLDFGCGSLRAGRLFLCYLDEGQYFGIEPNKWLIEDAISNQLGKDLIALKKPRFDHNDKFRTDVFSQQFDFIVAQSIFSHMGSDLITTALCNFGDSLKPGGIVAATFVEGNSDFDCSGWVYPGCVHYRRSTIECLAIAAGFSIVRIPWYHPRQTWYLLAKSKHRLPNKDMFHYLKGAVLCDSSLA